MPLKLSFDVQGQQSVDFRCTKKKGRGAGRALAHAALRSTLGVRILSSLLVCHNFAPDRLERSGGANLGNQLELGCLSIFILQWRSVVGKLCIHDWEIEIGVNLT